MEDMLRTMSITDELQVAEQKGLFSPCAKTAEGR
jgi:hypothetical protein